MLNGLTVHVFGFLACLRLRDDRTDDAVVFNLFLELVKRSAILTIKLPGLNEVPSIGDASICPFSLSEMVINNFDKDVKVRLGRRRLKSLINKSRDIFVSVLGLGISHMRHMVGENITTMMVVNLREGYCGPIK
jgi:hypothetical protein